MASSWKKSWRVRSYPEAVASMVRRLPEVFQGAAGSGLIARMGPTYSHQRKDFRLPSPRLSLEQNYRFVFQHEQIVPFTYTVELTPRDQETEVSVEVKASGVARDTQLAEQVLVLLYALTRALEPF
jgi:hypothetical protein